MGVFLKHPETKGVMEAVDINDDGGEAQAVHYESRGWVRVAGLILALAQFTGRDVEKIDDLTRDELADFAVQNNVNVAPSAKKADLVEAIDSHFGPEQEAEAAAAALEAPPEPATTEE